MREGEPMDPIDQLFVDIECELDTAMQRYPKFHSAHEGYAVLLEEIDELWQHVKVKQGMRITHAMRAEAVQCAAMAMRFALDCCGTDEEANR